MTQSLFRLCKETPRRSSVPKLVLVIAVTIGVAAAGCTSGTNAQSSPKAAGVVYLAVAAKRVEALLFNIDEHNIVTGTLNVDEILPSDPGHEQSHTTELTGTVAGSHLTLQPAGSLEHWSGDESGHALTLHYRGSDGSLVTTKFMRSDFAAHDRAQQVLIVQASQASPVASGSSAADVRAAQQTYAAALRVYKQAADRVKAAAAQASADVAAQNRVKAAAAQASADVAAQNRVKAAAARASAANAAAHRAA